MTAPNERSPFVVRKLSHLSARIEHANSASASPGAVQLDMSQERMNCADTPKVFMDWSGKWTEVLPEADDLPFAKSSRSANGLSSKPSNRRPQRPLDKIEHRTFRVRDSRLSALYDKYEFTQGRKDADHRGARQIRPGHKRAASEAPGAFGDVRTTRLPTKRAKISSPDSLQLSRLTDVTAKKDTGPWTVASGSFAGTVKASDSGRTDLASVPQPEEFRFNRTNFTDFDCEHPALHFDPFVSSGSPDNSARIQNSSNFNPFLEDDASSLVKIRTPSNDTHSCQPNDVLKRRNSRANPFSFENTSCFDPFLEQPCFDPFLELQ